jgi:hypothetical protein
VALEVLVGVLVVLGELDDEHTAVLVEVQRHRGAQERLGGDQFDAEAGPELERLEGVGRLLGRDERQLGGVVLVGGPLRQAAGARARAQEERGDQHGGQKD